MDPFGLSCLYRGVHAKQPALSDAKNGVTKPATPLHTMTPEQHAAAGGFTGNSQFVSWTPNLKIAMEHATKSGSGGVVLSVPQTAPPADAAWKWAWTEFNEQGEPEILQAADFSGASVICCC